MIRRFNQVSAWIVNEILHVSDAKGRAKIIDCFLFIAKQCEISYNNFNTSMEIYSALSSGTIARLKESWAHVSETGLEYMDKLRENYSSNYKLIRDALEIVTPPFLPYLGIVLFFQQKLFITRDLSIFLLWKVVSSFLL